MPALLAALAVSHNHLRSSTAQADGSFDRKASVSLKRVYQSFREQAMTVQSQARAEERLRLRERVRLEERNGRTQVGVIITLREGSVAALAAAQAEIEASGFQVRTRIGNIAVAAVNVDDLPRLAAVDAITALGAAGFSKATALAAAPGGAKLSHAALKAINDAANAAIKAPDARTTYNVTGRGVVIGVIDTGIDWKHGDFRRADGTTRIRFLWDMSDTANTGPGGVGRVYTAAEINAALQSTGTVNEKDTDNHGTHVAGIAGGNGLGTANGVAAGTFAGIAPEADLVIVKANRPGSQGFATDDQIASLTWIRDRAAELSEPFVINMSLGGHASQHDGSDSAEKAIDNLLAEGNNRQVIIAAGNEGAAPLHAGGIFDQGGEALIPFTLTPESRGLIGVYNAGDTVAVSVIKPDNTVLGPVTLGNTLSSDADVDIENSAGEAGTNANIFGLVFKRKPGGTFRLRLTGTKVINGRWDVWDIADGATPLDASVRDGLQHVGTPATSRRAITAANFVTRTQFTNLSGSVTTKNDEGQVGAGANSSSPGPTRDGRVKPEIGAPGAYIVSTLSADALNPEQGDISADGRHIAYTGTSMATPVTTGVVALMLQKAKDRTRALSPDEIKRILWRTVTNDSFTGPALSRKFGFGKINALAAVKAVEDNVTAAQFVSVSAADYKSDLAAAADAIMAGFGVNLAGGVFAASSLPLPTALGGVSVRVTDSKGAQQLAPLFFVAPTQINYTLPSGLALGTATIEVIRDGSVVANGAVSINTVWPAFFTTNSAGTGAAAINVLRVHNGQVSYDNENNPIDLSVAGDTVYAVLFGTGIRGRSGTNNVKITLGGKPLNAEYAGPQNGYAGLDQMNVPLPASLAGRGTLELIVYVDGWQTNTVRLSIK
ncbi:MAG TPA: S8 family serine peptidase [Blastocatellia bacterium]|nr:S8 family serine peptidase [Blastocatellia bacterium]